MPDQGLQRNQEIEAEIAHLRAEQQSLTPAHDHPSHTTRYSDSSVYDEVCTKCGATDARGDKRLKFPCPGDEV